MSELTESAAEAVEAAKHRFKIHIPDTNVQDGSAPISWCMTPEFVKMLCEQRVENPYVYIIVTPKSNSYARVKERRYAVPLQSMMAYVEFGSPGLNHVFAFVGASGGREPFFKPSRGIRWAELFIETCGWREESEDLRINLWEDRNMRMYGKTRIAVTVPESVFAKEPPVWLATWVNWLYDLPPIDSCEFRRRLYFFAAHIQFVVFALFMAIRIATYATLKLLLVGEVSARPILHPLRFDFNDMANSDNVVFLPWKWSRGAWWSRLYIPATPFTVLFVSVLFRGFPKIGFVNAFTYMLTGAVSWAALVTATVLLVKGVRAAYRWVHRPSIGHQLRSTELRAARELAREKRAAEKAAHRERKLYWYKDGKAVAPLICTPDAPKKPLASIADLPLERRTFALKLAEYKATSCKPYAK